jgi:hypothetical protein
MRGFGTQTPFWQEQFNPQYIARTRKPPKRVNEKLVKYLAQFYPDYYRHYVEAWHPDLALDIGTPLSYAQTWQGHIGGEVPAILNKGDFVLPKRFHSGGRVGGGGSGVSLPAASPKITFIVNNKTGVPFKAREEFSLITEKEMIKSVVLELMATDPSFGGM